MLIFERITIDSLPLINPFFEKVNYRTCDFSIGGLYMWIDYFGYEYCISENTLFIKGKTEDDLTKIAFAYPIGKLAIKDSIKKLKEYCESEGIELILSAVPEDCVPEIKKNYDSKNCELYDWFDYLYDADSQSTLAGRKLNKKRNRANKFRREHENFIYETINEDNIYFLKTFFDNFKDEYPAGSLLADYENKTVKEVLNDYDAFPFFGGVIKVGDQIAAFAIGEVIGDTLFIHIMKGMITYVGIYEVMSQEFISSAIQAHKEVKYVNREEDVGDLGLRRAKESYNPIALLKKYNVVIR